MILILNEISYTQIPSQRVELVKNMGILIKSSSLAAVLRCANRQPTPLL